MANHLVGKVILYGKAENLQCNQRLLQKVVKKGKMIEISAFLNLGQRQWVPIPGSLCFSFCQTIDFCVLFLSPPLQWVIHHHWEIETQAVSKNN